ncbi:MAG TPA: BTAD domain-containing putative transcriptional regulator [Pseudonocardiaceae bacterium]|jgi:DNA-binding SARP family transcriptional activator/DNA-binding CsgD family transcriptional regulator|nr:BTAD domain-containing putative transcriptional regulator [Pseudonocardiaceae bacterium]
MRAAGASSKALLRIQLLGPVRAWHCYDEVELGSARRRAVFAMLALRANETVSLAELVDGIWGDKPPARAVGILHTYVYDLRRALAPVCDQLLATVESSYSLRLPPEQLDEYQFGQHYQAAQRSLAVGDPATALREVDAALELWHGTALAGLSGPFAERHRGRLDELRVATIEQRGALLLARGNHADVIAGLSTFVAAHPFRETARSLLMIALYKEGRRAEALSLYQTAEQALINELGIEPGPALRRVHELIIDEKPVSADDLHPGMPARPGGATPDGLSEIQPPAPPAVLVGRETETTWLRALVADLLTGRGGCVWVEGAPGIGKTAVLARAFAEQPADHRVVWGLPNVVAGEADQATLDQAADLVERLCAERPLILVADDLSAADPTRLAVWRRLSRLTERLPLLLFGVCRTFAGTDDLRRLRNAVGGRVMAVGPLHSLDIAALAEQTLGVAPGSVLRDALRLAAGNPSYAMDLLTAAREIGTLDPAADHADLDARHKEQFDEVLTGVARRRLASLTPGTHEVLRSASLLGMEFDPGDLAVVLRVSAAELMEAVNEATEARVLLDSDRDLAFRDELLRQALLDERPSTVRVALHREVALALAEANAPVERIANQLVATPLVDDWAIGWLLDNVDTLGGRDPAAAIALLEHTADDPRLTDQAREEFAVRRVRLAFRLGRLPETEARSVLGTTTNPEYSGEMSWILAHLEFRAGRVLQAVAELRAAEGDARIPAFWRARCQMLRAEYERAGLGDLDTAALTADAALGTAADAADALASAGAFVELWYISTVRRDHAAALSYVDRALRVVGTVPELTQRRLNLLDNRAFSLQNLDRLDEASETLAGMCAIGARMQPPAGRPHVVLAVHYYWLGRWDEALAELALVAEDEEDTRFYDLRLQAPLLQHGVGALISARRGDHEALHTHLRAADAYPLITSEDHENSDFLLAARAIDAGDRSRRQAELSIMDPLLDLDYGRTTLRHQWLPWLLRLALDAGDDERARAAVRVCETEAEQESAPARAVAAAAWCRGLLTRDSAALTAIAGHYHGVGRRVDLADALVDTAVILAERHQTDPARQKFRAALAVFAEFGATADMDRAAARLHEFGIDEAAPPTQRPLAGWQALSERQQRIAELVGAGKSTPEIAAELGLARRDVQSRLFQVMRDLGATSRTELADKLAKAPPGA